MGDAEDAAALGSPFQGFQYFFFRLAVQVGRNFVQEQQPGFFGHSPGNVQQLEFSLGEQSVRHRGVLPLGQPVHRLLQAHQFQGPVRLVRSHRPISQGHLVPYGTGYRRKFLFHTAVQAPFLLFRQAPGPVPHQCHCPLLGAVQPQEQLEQGAFAAAAGPHKDHLFPRLQAAGKVLQNGSGRVIPEGHMGKSHCLVPDSFRQRVPVHRSPLLFVQEFPDMLDPGHGALDALDFHADALQGPEDFPHISNHRHGGPYGKAEEIRPGGPQGRPHHDHRHHCRLGHQDNGRIDPVEHIGPVDGPEAVGDQSIVPVFHILFLSQRMDGPDVPDGFRHMAVHPSDGPAVFPLGGQGPLLEVPGEPKQQGQQQAQDPEQPLAPAPQDPQNPQQLAGIRQHPHDPVRIQGIDGVPVVDKNGRGLAAGMAGEVPGRQPVQFGAQGGPETVGHLLAEQGNGPVLGGFAAVRQHRKADVQHPQLPGNPPSFRQAVHRPFQHQGRQKGGTHRKDYQHRHQGAGPGMGPEGSLDTFPNRILPIHPDPPLPAEALPAGHSRAPAP